MKTKSMLLLTLIALICAAGYSISCGSDDSDSSEALKSETVKAPDAQERAVDSTEVADSTASNYTVIAYYFHGTRRCVSCKKIEAYSREAIETGFEDELESGKLEFYSINIDEKENNHYVKDYDLYTKSLVISKVQGKDETEWKNLAKVWELLGSKEKFLEYVQGEIKAYLKES